MKKWLSYGILFLCIPVILLLGATVFAGKQYAFITLAVAVLACIPFVLTFENKRQSAAKLSVVAVMTALSVVGRFLFFAVPGFKPITAVVVITAMYLGPQAGFMTGALTAVISNFYFGQGAWTPFQMFTWGLIGFLGGILASALKRSRILLCVFGVASGIVYALLMDIYTVLWQENGFHFARYVAALTSGLPFMAVYACSNVIFLLVLAKPIGVQLQRIRDKYGL